MTDDEAIVPASGPLQARTPFWAFIVGLAALVVFFHYLPRAMELLGMGTWGLIAMDFLALFFVQVLWSVAGRRLGHYLARWGWIMFGTAIVALVNGYLARPLWFLAFWLVPISLVLLVRAAPRSSTRSRIRADEGKR